MRLQAVCSVIYWSLAVRAESIDSAESYYDYEYGEIATPTNDGTKKPPNKGTNLVVYSIEQFLNTTEKIWVYNSTEKSNKTCSVDAISEVTPFYVNMTRYYFYNGEIKKVEAQPVFEHHPIFATTANQYNEMRIKTPANSEPYETLLYQSDDSTCGVFFMNYHNDLSISMPQ
ncbi:uncharacterized protein LOC142765443 isoform X2 [Rhipicephalus microplus]|uniref:uncharacterized protein LOC142765443 isoform X2 n=1 Tax=Rhipicephalus microplus TaxID=6941 RepID=UPI003F6B37AB